MSLFDSFDEVLTLGEEYQLSDDNLSLVELGTVFSIDNTSLKSSLDIDEFSFCEKLLGSICKWSPCDTIGILSLGELLSGGSFVVAIGCDRECRYFLISSRYFDVGIFGDVTDEDDLVDSAHTDLGLKKYYSSIRTNINLQILVFILNDLDTAPNSPRSDSSM
jgi:hypothetical protein